MVDHHSLHNGMSTNDNTSEEISVFVAKFNIPRLSSDISSWDRGWEKVLRKLPSKDVYSLLSGLWDSVRANNIPQMQEHLNTRVHDLQGLLKGMWDDLEEKDHLYSLWVLLGEGERKRHLLNGLKEACEIASFNQDARALCPEITTSAMLKQRGTAFIDFVRAYAKALEEGDPDKLYLLPSDWWRAAVDKPEPWPENVEFVYKQLTIQRNEFIVGFLIQSLMSVMHDLCNGSPGMDPVKNFLETDNFATACAKTLGSLLEKPLIRCENCTKCPEDIGENAKFMVCSRCRSKLGFLVHYCSQKCQKEDWANHKKYCGKKKVSKDLPGTARDPLWAFTKFPESVRSLRSKDGSGSIAITDMGFGTLHPSHPHSRALQRQVSLLTGDKEADYFLFDDVDHPIRFAIDHAWLKMCFRIVRSRAVFEADHTGVETIAEYLIKAMGPMPELGRRRILAQFSREYGEDFLSGFTVFERRRIEEGRPGMTLLEEIGKGIPTMMQKFPVPF